MTPEGRLKSKLRQGCNRRGFLCLPLSYPGQRGWPDRIIIGLGHVFFVEVKTDKVPLDNEHCDQQRKVVSELVNDYGVEAYFVVGQSGIEKIFRRLDEIRALPVSSARA
jgi:hypothetical protein